MKGYAAEEWLLTSHKSFWSVREILIGLSQFIVERYRNSDFTDTFGKKLISEPLYKRFF